MTPGSDWFMVTPVPAKTQWPGLTIDMAAFAPTSMYWFPTVVCSGRGIGPVGQSAVTSAGSTFHNGSSSMKSVL